MNQNYQFLDRGSLASSKSSRSAKKPPLENDGLRERTWRSYLNQNYYCTAFLMLFFLLFSSWESFAQVSINETFDATSTPAGWTYTSFARNATNPCAGAGSLRKNQWSSSTTASATTPTWTSNGESVSIQFNYKLLNYHSSNPTVATPNSPAWGSIVTELSVDGGSTYTVTAGTIDATNHTVATTCATKSYTVPGASVPAGSSLKVRFRLTFAGSTPDYFVYMDDVVISQLSTSPPNCITGTISPANGASVVSSSVFSWAAATGGPSGYKFYLGTDTEATNLVNGASTTALTYTYGSPLVANTTYYWKVVPTNLVGDAVSCPVWSFTAGIPQCISTFSPANESVSSYQKPRITWDAVPGATSYDVYFGTSATPALIGNQTGLTYMPASALTANTTYYWKVVPKNVLGSAVDCVTNSLTTASALYCVPVTTSGCTDGDVIARVQLNTLDNNSGTGCPSGTLGYSDYTSNPSLTTTLQAGSSYQCRVWAGQYSEGYAAWIDYNDNGTFESNERIGFSSGQVTGSGSVGVLGSSATFTISLPCNPPVGVHRMRVRAMYNTSGSSVTPCTDNSYGEIEDYLVTITEPAACPQPSNLLVGTVTSTTANLSWTLGCAEAAWEVLVQPASAPAPTEESVGAAATAVTYQAQGLSGGTVYSFYVRANCGPDGTSVWSGPVNFTTVPDQAPLCATPLLPANGATDLVLGANASINISWEPSTTGQAATSYDVYFGQTSTTLFNIGNTTGTNVNITGLAAGETNYWKIVPKNSVGSAEVDECTVFSFTTAVPAGDTCDTAINLGAQTSPYTSTTANFSNHVNLACYESGEISPDAYYYIDVPANYTLNIGQTVNGYDSVIYVGYGTCGNLTAITCFDEPDTQTTSWMNLTGGTARVYWIQDGYGDSGSFTLAWSLVPPPDCLPPTAMVTNVSGTSANISWTASESAPTDGYQYEVRSSGAVLSGSTGLITSGTTADTFIPTVTGLTIGTTYTVHVRSLCSEGVSSTWNSKSFLVPVANDACSGAITLTCGGSTTGSTVGATNENMPVCGITDLTTQNSAGVWYKFTGDGSDVTITTCGPTQVDTRMAVYTGECGELTCVAGNEDNSACTTANWSSEVLLSTFDGAEYYVLVYAFGNTSTVNFNIAMSCVAPCSPATTNDNCSTAQALTLGTPLASNNTCSTPSTGVAYPSCGSVFATYYDTWYTFNSGSNTTLEIALAATAPTAVGYALYTGTCGGTFTQRSCNMTGVAANVTVTANTNYYLRVFTEGAANRGNFTVSVKPPCLVPTGITPSAVTVSTATVAWTASTSNPSNGYEYEVRFTGAAGSGESGLVASGTTSSTSVNLTDLLEDTQHRFYIRSVCGVGNYGPWTTGTNFTTLTNCYKPTTPAVASTTSTSATFTWNVPTEGAPEVGYGWEVRTTGAAGSGSTGLVASGNTSALTITTNALSGSTAYTFYVRSRCGGASTSGWTTGVAFSTPPANDVCSGAITITCGGPALTGTTVGATNELMAVCGISGVTTQNTPGVWYKYVSDGTDVTFSTCAAGSGDTRLAVFKGTCASMVCVGGNDDNSACTASTLSSEVTIADTQAGATYYVLVYAYSSANPGTTTVNFTLSATCAPACTPASGNNECANAKTIVLGTTASNNSCATASLGFAYPSCVTGGQFLTFYDTWYKFNTGTTTFVDISLTPASGVTVGYALYSGTCDGLTQVSCNATGALNSVTGLTTNTVYYLRVYSTTKPARGNYSINLSVPCRVPTGLTATNTQNSVSFFWTASESLPMNGYQYEIRTSGAAGSGATGRVASGNVSALSKEVTGLTPNTNYTLYVRSACGTSDFSAWTTGVIFFTGFCTPAPTSGIADGIVRVSYDTVDNATGSESGNYGNYTAMSGMVQRANTAVVKINTATAANVKVWVDWNNDLDFNDVGEEVFSGATVGDSISANFVVPTTTSVGTHRMRIAAGSSSSLTPCYTGASAAFEDYTLNVDTSGPANLNSAACNSTVSNFNQPLYINNIAGVQAYRFRVRWNSNEVILNRNTTYITLNLLPSPAYGVTYLIDVSVMLNGQWTDYGKVCKVTTVNAVAATRLENCSTGTSVAAFSTPIYAVGVPMATNYRFLVTSSQGTYTFDRPSRYFTINQIPGYDYNVNYTVRVSALVSGIWSEYGDSCVVRVDMPTATIKAQYCNGTVAKKGTPIYANNYPGAVSYHFRVTHNGNQYIVVRNVGYFSLSQVPTTIALGSTVGVEVKVFTAGAESDWGALCPVTLLNPAGRPGTAGEVIDEEPIVKLSGFPNPFSETFALDFTSESEEMVNIVVYDMTGKLVDRRSVSVNELPTLKIGDNFAAGVYNLILTQGETVKTLRVVKSIN